MDRSANSSEVPPEDEPSDPPRPDSLWLAARRKSWARLIRRVYEVDLFLCRRGERMRVVSTPDVCADFERLLTIPGKKEMPVSSM
jgi:hypothetical protein